MTQPKEKSFNEKLIELVNEYGIDAQYSIPDYIIGNYLMRSLNSIQELKVELLQHGISGD